MATAVAARLVLLSCTPLPEQDQWPFLIEPQVNFSMGDLFANPTLAGMAARLLTLAEDPERLMALARVRQRLSSMSSAEKQALYEAKQRSL